MTFNHTGQQDEAYGTPALATDLLKGADAIAEFCGIKARAVYHLAERGELPVFRMGALLCARRSTILQHIAEQEARNTRVDA